MRLADRAATRPFHNNPPNVVVINKTVVGDNHPAQLGVFFDQMKNDKTKPRRLSMFARQARLQGCHVQFGILRIIRHCQGTHRVRLARCKSHTRIPWNPPLRQCVAGSRYRELLAIPITLAIANVAVERQVTAPCRRQLHFVFDIVNRQGHVLIRHAEH